MPEQAQKLLHFTDNVLKTATEESEALARELEAKRQAALTEARQTSRDDAHAYYERESARIRAEAGQEVSRHLMDGKRQVYLRRSEISREVLDKVRAGNSLSESLALVDGFEQSMSSSIAVGEETGKLDELLATISETLDFEAEVATKRLVTLLEPIMIVIMGVIVAFVVVAVILPIYQSYGTIGQSSSTY